MLSFKSFAVASAALTFFSGVNAGQVTVIQRNQEQPSAPSCTSFTPFVYSGCFTDPGSPRALLYDSGLNTQNMTVEICVAFCKGNDFRYAGLEYWGQCFCGASVNGPQIAESNCNYPCTGDNNEACGGNDIISIYQDPTFPTVNSTTITDYQPLGCYSEGTSGRSLAWPQSQISPSAMTVEACLAACKQGGYDMAGVEYGQQCYCGVVLGNGTVPTSGCNMPCSGNTAETCGGSSVLNLFVASDLESTQICGAVPPSASSNPSSSSSNPSGSSSTSSGSSSTTSVSNSNSASASGVSGGGGGGGGGGAGTPSASGSSSSLSSPVSNTGTSSAPSSSSSISNSVSALGGAGTSSSLGSSSRISSSVSSTGISSNPSTSTRISSSVSSSLSRSTTIPTTSSTSPTLCTSTVSPTPTCEYQCGQWCSTPLPTWTDQSSCLQAQIKCVMQVAQCYLQASYPGNLSCSKFSAWCQSVSSYCTNSCHGSGCSKNDCTSKYPPVRPSSTSSAAISTSVYACPTSSH